MDLPTLAAVPSIVADLTVKTTANGIIYLREGRFQQRYTGNKYSCVDINGNLWIKASELKKQQALERGEGTKKPRPKKSQGSKNLQTEPTNYNNISTTNGEISTTKPALSTKPRAYQVNKTEVRARLLGFMNTQRGKKELYFWTVTFPAKTPDDLAYQAFNIWLTSLRQYGLLKDYLWVAERQDGKRISQEGKAPTNTIHFHVAIPHKMPVKRANAMMAGTLVNMARKGLLQESIFKLKRYNGVDIAKNRKTKRVTNFAVKKGARALSTYLTKYVTKNEGTFEHLAWHNSRGYSSIFTGLTFTETEFRNFGFPLFLDRKKQVHFPYFTFCPWGKDGPPAAITEHLYQLNSYLQNHLN